MKIPAFENEDEEREFWATHDSMDYIDGAEAMWINADYTEGIGLNIYEAGVSDVITIPRCSVRSVKHLGKIEIF